jgi:hypothetical protein
MHAETANVVAKLMEDTVDKLDAVYLRHVLEQAEHGETADNRLAPARIGALTSVRAPITRDQCLRARTACGVTA